MESFLSLSILKNMKRSLSFARSFIWRYVRQYKKTSFAVLAAVLVVGGFVLARDPAAGPSVAVVKRGEVQQEVNVTGRVTTSDSVTMAFEKSGRVIYIAIQAGARVRPGQLLVQLDSGELYAQRIQALAAVQAAQVKLDQTLSGARQEDVNITRTTLENARNIFEVVRNKDSVDAAQTAFNAAANAFVAYSKLQLKYLNMSYDVAFKKDTALAALYGGGSDLGRADASFFLVLSGGLRQTLNRAETAPESVDIPLFLSQMKNGLSLTADAVNYIYYRLGNVVATDAERSEIATIYSNVLAQISAITAQQQALVTAQNNVNDAQARLSLKEAPASQFDVDLARADLSKAQGNLALIEAQIGKGMLRSPVSGIVGKVTARRGEVIAAGSPAVSVISDEKFKIESNVSEADIAKIKIGNPATVKLDAYGSDTVFPAHVITINPGEDVVEGVATYQVTLQFDKDDPKILSGLTADVSILTAQRQDVLYIPTRNIITRGGFKYAKLLIDEKSAAAKEVQVTVGLKGSDGRTEIVSGLKEGDRIVID